MLSLNGSAGAMWIMTRLAIPEKQPDINLQPVNKLRLFKSRFSAILSEKGENWIMTPEEMSDLYIRIAFHYDSTVDRLLGKGLIDKDFADYHRKTFYDSLDEEKLRTSQKIGSQIEIMQRYVRAMVCGAMVSLTKIAKNTQKILLGMSFKAGCEAAILWSSSANGKMT